MFRPFSSVWNRAWPRETRNMVGQHCWYCSILSFYICVHCRMQGCQWRCMMTSTASWRRGTGLWGRRTTASARRRCTTSSSMLCCSIVCRISTQWLKQLPSYTKYPIHESYMFGERHGSGVIKSKCCIKVSCSLVKVRLSSSAMNHINILELPAL